MMHVPQTTEELQPAPPEEGHGRQPAPRDGAHDLQPAPRDGAPDLQPAPRDGAPDLQPAPADGAHDQPLAQVLVAGPETVIKFVFSGPILPEHAGLEQVMHVGPSEDVSGLRERVTALERAVVDANNRVDALSKALAVAVVTANGGSAAAAPRPAPAPAPVVEAPTLKDRLGSVSPRGDAGVTPDPDVAAAPTSAEIRVPSQLSAVAPPPPTRRRINAHKARGLRRMISVLKHN